MSFDLLAARAALLPKFADDNAPMGTQSTLGAMAAGTGGAMALGGAGLGLGGHLASRGLERMTNFTPEATKNVQNLVGSLDGVSPAKGLTNYVTHGSALSANPITTSGKSGLEYMKSVYNNPLVRHGIEMFAPGAMGEPGWHPSRAQHYEEFAASPARAQAQIAREVYNSPDAVKGMVGQDVRGGSGAHEAVNKRVEALRQRLVGKGQLGADQAFEWWNKPEYKKFFQPQFDRADAAARATEQTAARTVGRMGGDAGDVMRRQLYRFAKTDPEAAAAMRSAGLKGTAAVDSLPRAIQSRLLGRFNEGTNVGGGLARDSAQLLKGNVGRYGLLSGVVTKPDSVLRGLAEKARGVRNFGGILGLGGLGLGALGYGAYSAGRSADASSADERSQEHMRKLVSMIRGEAPESAAPQGGGLARLAANASAPTAREQFSSAVKGGVKDVAGNVVERLMSRYGG